MRKQGFFTNRQTVCCFIYFFEEAMLKDEQIHLCMSLKEQSSKIYPAKTILSCGFVLAKCKLANIIRMDKQTC